MQTITTKLKGLPMPADGAGAVHWRAWLPKTMAGMVAGGCVLAAAPLLATVLLASLALDRLSMHTRQLVDEGLTVVRLGGQLREDVVALERNARQYVALGDPALLHVFNSRLQALEETLRQIEQHDLRAAFADDLDQARARLTDAVHGWNAGLKSGGPLDDAVETVRGLTAVADGIVAAGRSAIDAQVEELGHASLSAQRLILFSSLALIPLTALLAAGFSLVITRPLRRLARGITALGHAQYGQPIAIEFPREMQQLGQQLDWLRRRLAQLEADKDGFLRHVSHELKTPLASLREGAGLLWDRSLGPLSERQAEVAHILAESADELNGQIHNLLTYAEWREERRQAEMSEFEAAPLVAEVLAGLKLIMTRRSLRPELDLQAERLFGQRSRLRVALDNLLTNAVKHAPPGTAIEIRTRRRDGCCELSVRDHGRGVPPADRARIFEPFVRGTEAEEAGIRGTGVGLSIVKDTVVAHEGMVEVEDAQPGARFTLTWPCPPDEDAR